MQFMLAYLTLVGGIILLAFVALYIVWCIYIIFINYIRDYVIRDYVLDAVTEENVPYTRYIVVRCRKYHREVTRTDVRFLYRFLLTIQLILELPALLITWVTDFFVVPNKSSKQKTGKGLLHRLFYK